MTSRYIAHPTPILDRSDATPPTPSGLLVALALMVAFATLLSVAAPKAPVGLDTPDWHGNVAASGSLD